MTTTPKHPEIVIDLKGGSFYSIDIPWIVKEQFDDNFSDPIFKEYFWQTTNLPYELALRETKKWFTVINATPF